MIEDIKYQWDEQTASYVLMAYDGHQWFSVPYVGGHETSGEKS